MSESQEPEGLHEFIPLTPQDFQVLSCLLEQPLHGYGIVKNTESVGAPIELGSLYRILSRLMDDGLIEEVETSRSQGKRKRRVYGLTRLGSEVVRAEALRLRAMLENNSLAKLMEGK